MAEQLIVEKEAMFCSFKRCLKRTLYCKHIPFIHLIKDEPDLLYCCHIKRILKDLRTNIKGGCNA